MMVKDLRKFQKSLLQESHIYPKKFMRRMGPLKILHAISLLTLGAILLGISSCSASNDPSSRNLPIPEEIQSVGPLRPMQRIPEPGLFPYPPSTPRSLAFPEVWNQYTEEQTDWYILAGPGLLMIHGARIQAFEPLDSLGIVGLPKGLSNTSEEFLWEQQLPIPPYAPPILSNDRLIWALPGFGLVALDRISGSVIWEVNQPGVFSTLHVYESASTDSPGLAQVDRFLDQVLVVSDRYQGMVFISPLDGSRVSGPYPDILGQVLILENNSLMVVSEAPSYRGMSEDQFILSTLFPFSQSPSVSLYALNRIDSSDEPGFVLKPQFLETALGSVIHPSGQGLLIYQLLGSRRIETRHLVRSSLELGTQDSESRISSRVLWTSDFTLRIDQGVRIQGSFDSRVGVWPLILVTDDRYIRGYHGGLGIELGFTGVGELRSQLETTWESTQKELASEGEPLSLIQQREFAGTEVKIGTIFVPGVRADHMVGLRKIAFPGLTGVITPVFLGQSDIGLLTSWGLYGSQPKADAPSVFSSLLSPLLPESFLDQENPRDFLPETLHFIDPIKSSSSELLWNVGISERIRIAFPALSSPLRVRVSGQKPGMFFYQTQDPEISPLLVQVYHQDHMVYTNASHVSLDSQGRFELTESQNYEIHITWALGDEGIHYGIGSFLLEREP